MIKFFRKIRQNQLSENKFSKYLLYAIGEIVLVVIGILIALSINNWNENRKNKVLLSDYTESLINDLRQDTIILNRVIKSASNDIINQEILAQRLSSIHANIDTLKTIVKNDLSMNYAVFRPPNRNTLLAIQANGIIELFDEKTYNYLIELQTAQNITEAIITAQTNLFQTQADKFLTKYSFDYLRVIDGPLYEEKWKSVDGNELLSHVEAFMSTKKFMNVNGNKRRKELLELTQLTLNRLIEKKDQNK
jgi:hypothetical protein